MDRLAVIVPTRGRPGNIERVIGAWDFTCAWDVADLVLAVDADDPEIQGYRDLVAQTEHPDTGDPLVRLVVFPEWLPMVDKLNATAMGLAEGLDPDYFALGFAGDDHVPQTINWAKTYLRVLRELGTGMVYGDDGYQGRKLSTEWAVTADAVRALGRMVPAPVEHMYCDNAIMELFNAAGALRHLPEIRIEHMHPIAGKAETDAQYKRVNDRAQFSKDLKAYENWKNGRMSADLVTLKALRPGRPGRSTTKEQKKMSRSPFPRYFKQVKGVTPEDIGVTLADFAVSVPRDQAIVELGTYHGKTALQLAWGAQQGNGAHVWAFDPWELPGNVYGTEMGDLAGARAWARYWVRNLGYDNHITLIQAFSHEAAGEWDGTPVGLLFIDGDHTYEGARRDIEAWTPHLAPGATIAVDDYVNENYPDVARAVNDLVDEGVLDPVTVFHDRLGVTRLVEPGDPGVAVTRAITAEGVSPSPYPAVAGQVVDDGQTIDLGAPSVVDQSELIDERTRVYQGELIDIEAGTSIEDLRLPQLKMLARKRDIVLGARKDKRSDVLQALREGR